MRTVTFPNSMRINANLSGHYLCTSTFNSLDCVVEHDDLNLCLLHMLEVTLMIDASKYINIDIYLTVVPLVHSKGSPFTSNFRGLTIIIKPVRLIVTSPRNVLISPLLLVWTLRGFGLFATNFAFTTRPKIFSTF